jgi:LysM repeat protein
MPAHPLRRPTTVALAAALGTCALQAAPAAAAEDASDDARRSAPAAAPARATGGTAPATTTAGTAATARPVVTLAAPVRGQTTYRVRSGDTVSHIAQRLGVTQAAILAANGLDARGFIREGQVLVVPGAASGTRGAAAPAATSSTYTVRSGDTLGHIAQRTGTTVAALTAANGLDSRGFIREGQRLSVPGGRTVSAATVAARGSGSSAASGGSSYTVRSGDTLSHIAARSGVSLSALRAANPGVGDRIQVGQRLTVPAAAGRTGTVGNTFAGRTYPSATVAAAQANKDALAARSVPSRGKMQAMVASTASANGVDPALAQAIAFQESGFDMRAVSPANAVGVMQVIPSSGVWASELAGRRLDLLVPQDNVLAGVLILKANLRAAGDQDTAIAAYYQGLRSVRANGMYADTRRYVANVQTLTATFR